MRPLPSSAPLLLVALLAALMAGCTPTHDWRDARLGDGELAALFPCRPDHHRRQVPLAGGQRWMNLSSCQAGDATFAVSMVDAERIDQVTPTYEGLTRALSTNLGATQPAPGAQVRVSGASPHPLAGPFDLAGRRGDGQVVQARVLMFSKGLHVYQATVLGPRLDSAAVDTFFSSLRFPT